MWAYVIPQDGGAVDKALSSVMGWLRITDYIQNERWCQQTSCELNWAKKNKRNQAIPGPCYHLHPYIYARWHRELPGFGCHSRIQHKLTTIVYQNMHRLGCAFAWNFHWKSLRNLLSCRWMSSCGGSPGHRIEGSQWALAAPGGYIACEPASHIGCHAGRWAIPGADTFPWPVSLTLVLETGWRWLGDHLLGLEG